MTFDQTKLPDGTIEDPKILEKKIFDGGYGYVISNRTQKGFTITLNKKAVDEITFSWIALSVKDSKKFESAALIVTPTPTPQPTVEPSLQTPPSLPSSGQAGQAITPSQEASPSAQ